MPTFQHSVHYFSHPFLWFACWLTLLPGSGHLPSMGNILSAFILSAPIQEDALYFEDYCSKHELDRPGREQLASDPAAYIRRLSVAGMFRQVFIIFAHCQCITLGACRALSNSPACLLALSTFWATLAELSLLQHLQGGGGISTFEYWGFLEKCRHCFSCYLPTALHHHIPVCSGRN